jgi:hypothetical protein
LQRLGEPALIEGVAVPATRAAPSSASDEARVEARLRQLGYVE